MLYKEYNDYELISLAHEQNEDAINIIYEKYKPIIVSKCNTYIKYIKGIELSDLIQECYIVLNTAINTFNQEKDNIFYTFINLCLDRYLISEYKKSNNTKNKLLNESLSLDSLDNEDKNLIKIIKDDKYNPELELIQELNFMELYNKIIDKLTYLEELVFILKVQNFNYKEIASILDKDSKSIDNAIQRIKTKIKEVYN